MRGTDAAWREALPRIDRNVDPPTRTVFLLHGFESDVSELFYAWGSDWTYFDKLGPAPTAKLRIPTIATTHSGRSRPPVPIDRDQCGAGAVSAAGCSC